MPHLQGIDFAQLQTAIDWSISQLEKPRNQRVELVRQYVGSHYSRGGADKVVPVNLLELAVTIYVRTLAARAPQVMINTNVDELRPFAKNMELALNQIPDEIGLAKTLRRVVLEALFGIGVVKVGLASSGTTVRGRDPGQAYVEVVSLDDYFVDMAAKSRDAIQFEGNDYWLDIASARALWDGTEGTAEDVKPDDHTVQGDRGEDRAESVGVDEGADLYKEKVWLRDVWLPGTQQVITYGVKSKKVFRVIPWDGPEHGPYYTLSYTDVPGNILPLPPASLWLDLHEVANTLFRKLSKQAVSKKTVMVFTGGNDEDIHRMQKAEDGDGIRYNGGKPEAVTIGGIDPQELAFFLQSRDLFSYFGGNLDALGGLSPQTETGVQDKMLADAASARTDSMSAETIDFTRRIFKALAWYDWTNPERKRTIRKPVEGSDIVLEREWSDETREGDFLDFNLDIDPYSMQDDTPASKLQKIGQILERFVFPIMDQIQQQGGQLDSRKLMEMIARLSNVDEVRDLIVYGEPIQGDPAQSGGSQKPSFKPANTTRNYTRTSIPGGSRHGNDAALSQILMGAGVQQSQAAAIGRLPS